MICANSHSIIVLPVRYGVKTTKKVATTVPQTAEITHLYFGPINDEDTTAELYAAWVSELPPPVGMAYPFTQEKNPLQYTTFSLTV